MRTLIILLTMLVSSTIFGQQNIALNKTAKQSSEYDTRYSAVSKVVNGNTDDRYARIFLKDNGKTRLLSLTENKTYSTKVTSSSSVTSSTDKNLFIIEMLGSRGILTFPDKIANKPKNATIKLFSNKQTVKKRLVLYNIVWDGKVLTADIRDTKNKNGNISSGLDADVNKIKLTFGSNLSDYNIVGVLTSNTQSWVSKKNTIVLGHGNKSSGNSAYVGSLKVSDVFPKRVTNQYFALVVNDKHADKSRSDESKYSYGWYIEPSIATSNTFRMVHLIEDNILDEIALYAFENKEGRTLEEAKKDKQKAYPLNGILNEIKKIYPDMSSTYSYFGLRADLSALLIFEATSRYPSEVLGFKSSGHGTPYGIMNGLLRKDYGIKRCFAWVKDNRGKNIDFLDFGTNCNSSSLYNLQSVAPYVNYVLASDLTRNTPVRPNRPSDGGNYATYFDGKTKDVPTILKSMMNVYAQIFNDEEAKKHYVDVCNDVGEGKYYKETSVCLSDWKQQLTLFDMRAFQSILANIGGVDNAMETCLNKLNSTSKEALYFPEGDGALIDLKQFIETAFPDYRSLSQDWNKFVMHQVNNKVGLKWDTNSPQGVLMNQRSW